MATASNKDTKIKAPGPRGIRLAETPKEGERRLERRASDRLKPIINQILAADSIDDLLEGSLTEDLQYILNAETVTIYAVDPFKKQLYACNYLSASGEEIRLDIAETSLAGLAARTKEVINVTNAFDRNELNSLHPNLTPDKAWIKKVKQKSLPVILAPMTQNKKLTGILEVLNKTNGGAFVDEDIRLIEEVASTLSHTLAKRELGVSEELVRATSHVIHSATTVDDIFLKLKDPIKRLFSAQAVIIYAVNEAKMSLYTKERSGDNIKDISMPIKANNIPGYVALEKKLTNFKNVRDKKVLKGIHPDISYDKSDDKRLGLKAQSMLVYPLLSNKKLMGVLQIIKDEDTFYSQDVKNINTIGESLALALFNKKKQIQLKPTKYSYLISNGILTQEELTRATSKARSAGKEVEYYLIKKLKIKTADIGKSLSKYYSMPYQGYSDSILLPKNLFAGLNLNFLIKNSWFPIEKDEKKVVILIDDPLDLDKIRNIELTFPKKDIEYKVSLKSEIHKFLETTPEEEEVEEESRPMEAMSSLLESLETEKSIEDAILESAQQEQELSAISETDNTIVRLANKILIDAYEQGVSDIHIEPGIEKKPIKVRFRKDGVCRVYQEIPYLYKQAMISRLKIMARMDIAEKRLPQDGKIKMKYGKKNIEYRVATCPTVGGHEDAVLRILSSSIPIPLEGMNFSERNLNLIKKCLPAPMG